MSGVRVLVGTHKGAFILTSDEKRQKWNVDGPYFAGWEIYHINGSPADPNRLYASQSTGWFGQQIQRSDDGGKTWNPVDNKFVYEGVPGTHLWYDGTPHPWEFKRVWRLEPSLTDPDTVFAGVEDAALFRSNDGGHSWQELPGLRSAKGNLWQPGAGGMCLHTILLDPVNPNRMFVAISAAGAFRTDDGGQNWLPINRGLISNGELPDPTAEVGHCVHNIAMHPSRPDVLFMQKHWDVMRSDDAGGMWHEVSGNLPTDFGFPIAVHAHEPETIYVVPIKSDSEPSPRACPRATVMLIFYAAPWQSISLTRAESILAPPPGRCMPRQIQGIAGPPLLATCLTFYRLQSRPCHDPRNTPLPPAAAGEC